MLSLLVPVVFAGAPQPPEGWVNARLRDFNAHASAPVPELDDRQLSELRAGKVVRVLERREDGGLRAVGYVLTEAERPEMWLGCQDLHYSSVARLTERRLAYDGHDRATWYGFLDLPAPFDDRHWVVDVWNNHGLTEATGAWEHPWRLRADGLAVARPWAERGALGPVDAEAFDDAIYTPFNEGAWFALALPEGGTLFGYHASSSPGGYIPDRLMTEYVMSTLDDMLRGVEQRAEAQVPEHYVEGHAPIYDGAGEALPTYGDSALVQE